MGSLNLTSPCSLLPVHSLHCERTAHRTLLLRTLGPMGDQVLFHDLLSEAKDLRFLRIDDGPHPMRIRVAKGLYPTFRTEAVILVNFLAIKPHISLSQEL
jgi:hypothetical protein